MIHQHRNIVALVDILAHPSSLTNAASGGELDPKEINEAPAQVKAADFEKTMILRPGAMKAMAPHATPVSAPATAPAAVAPGTANAATAPPPAAKSFGDTMVNQGALSAVPSSPVSPPPTVASVSAVVAPQKTGSLQILSGGSAGRSLELTKPLTTLGKPGVQVAVITRRPQGFFITHVEGANFPIINGKTLDAQAHALKDHDIIELAGVKMEFFLKT